MVLSRSGRAFCHFFQFSLIVVKWFCKYVTKTHIFLKPLVVRKELHQNNNVEKQTTKNKLRLGAQKQNKINCFSSQNIFFVSKVTFFYKVQHDIEISIILG